MNLPTGALGFWERCANIAELWWSRHGAIAPEGVARERLRALVEFARANSPFYRRLYARVARDEADPRNLPRVSKARLMARFDDWASDRRITRAGVDEFLADRARIGERHLGLYQVWKSSGTSGTPGIFLQDDHAMAVYDALIAAQVETPDARLAIPGARAALIAATGDHFAAIGSWQRVTREHPELARRSFSVLEPTARLVARLNDYQPAFIASYPSVLALLAAEQAAGRLRIAPALAWSGGEHLGRAAQRAIERALGCVVMNEYGASECLSIAYGCREGWLHVNREWVLVEPIDAAGRPTPPGELSRSVLITNLANWAQPIIRYDLGDRVLARPTPCPCGNPLPAIFVEGRTDAIVRLRAARGGTVALAPLALATAVEEAAGEQRFQIAQTGPRRLALRFDAGAGREIPRRAAQALEAYLASQSLTGVQVAIDRQRPRLDAHSGKLRAVVVETA